jgi:hypothetical protein
VAVGGSTPPSLIIVFVHEEPARELFIGLRANVGQDDEEELLRVSIVEGTFYGKPHSCAVNIGPEVENVLNLFQAKLFEHETSSGLCLAGRMISKGHAQHLGLFKEQFLKTGSYFLVPGLHRRGSLCAIAELRIKKRSISFRRKEDISPSDLDGIVLELGPP